MSTKDFSDTSAQCPKHVVYKGANASCNACEHQTLEQIYKCHGKDNCTCGEQKNRNDGLCCSEFVSPFSKDRNNFTTNGRRCGVYPRTNEGLNRNFYTSPDQQQKYRSCAQACWPRRDEALDEKFERRKCYADASPLAIAAGALVRMMGREDEVFHTTPDARWRVSILLA